LLRGLVDDEAMMTARHLLGSWLAAGAAVGLLSAGCDLHGDTYEAPLSTSGCITGWNAGTVSWAKVGSGPWRPTRDAGLIARQLLVVAGSECRIAFDLGGGRYVVFASSGVRQSSQAPQGLRWWLSPGSTNAYGVMSGTEAGLNTPGIETTTACQDDAGTIQLSGCTTPPAAAKNYPVDAVQRRLVLGAIRDAFHPYPSTRVYWLGDLYRGYGARALGHLAQASTFGYPVTVGPRVWMVDVVTSDPGHPAPRCDSPLRGVPCSRPVRLFTVQEGHGTWVTAFSMLAAGTGPAAPPAAVVNDLRAKLTASPV
jgi:hypothetical protein